MGEGAPQTLSFPNACIGNPLLSAIHQEFSSHCEGAPSRPRQSNLSSPLRKRGVRGDLVVIVVVILNYDFERARNRMTLVDFTEVHLLLLHSYSIQKIQDPSFNLFCSTYHTYNTNTIYPLYAYSSSPGRHPLRPNLTLKRESEIYGKSV